MICKSCRIVYFISAMKMGIYTLMTFQNYIKQFTKIIDLYSQRGKTPEQDATLCLAILMGYNVSMYANPEDEERKQAVLTRSLSLLDVLPPSLLKQQLSAVCHEMQELCEIN